jgi:hypothetical protein
MRVARVGDKIKLRPEYVDVIRKQHPSGNIEKDTFINQELHTIMNTFGSWYHINCPLVFGKGPLWFINRGSFETKQS